MSLTNEIVIIRLAANRINMYQIVCRLGLRPRELTALPQTPIWFRGGAPGEREEGREAKKEEGRGREGRESRNAQIKSSQA